MAGAGLVAAGGAAGSVLRYAAGIWCAAWFGTWMPWGTLAVNLIGSGLIGLLGGAMLGGLPFPQEARLLVITGLLGGFTTFSAFSLEAALMIERREIVSAFVYAAGSVVLAIAALFVGLMIARKLFIGVGA